MWEPRQISYMYSLRVLSHNTDSQQWSCSYNYVGIYTFWFKKKPFYLVFSDLFSSNVMGDNWLHYSCLFFRYQDVDNMRESRKGLGVLKFQMS